MPSANLLDLLAQLSLDTDELDEPDLDGPDPEEEDLSHAVPEQGTGDLHSDRKSTRLNSSHSGESRMPSSA